MSLEDKEKLNKIEDLKVKLFSKNYKINLEHRDNFINSRVNDIPSDWQEDNKFDNNFLFMKNKFFTRNSFFKNIFLFSLVFLVLTIFYALYVFWGGGNIVSNNNIDISILGDTFTTGGEEFSFIVGITNKNNSPLELVDMIVEYPKNSSNSEVENSSSDMVRNRFSLGTIPVGALRNENVKVVLFGEENSVQAIKIYLEYRVEDSNAIFVKEKSYDVTINSTPINLSIDAPESISPNQDISFNVKTLLNSSTSVSNLLLKIEYPFGFKFTSSIPNPAFGNNIWNLGDMSPGMERNILINGRMIDVFDGEEKNFHITSGLQSDVNKSVIDSVLNSKSYVIKIEKPFIEARLFVDGLYKKEYTLDTNNTLKGMIEWNNNLDTKINDLSIKAKIVGNAVNRKTIRAEQGFYDSGNNEIIWDKNYKNEFSEVSPGSSGTVSFSVSSLPLYSLTNGMLSNPSIDIEISISGKQLVDGYEMKDLNNFITSKIKIISDLNFSNKIVYYSGPFVNKGPIPPKVENETSYTITWSLSNTSNNISKAVLRSTLPPWVRFSGLISGENENLNYNSSTREIFWNIGQIPKGTGITSPSKSVSFQILFKPSLSQLKTIPILINEAILTGHDDFANVDIRLNKTSLRTMLDNDSLFPSNGASVVE